MTPRNLIVKPIWLVLALVVVLVSCGDPASQPAVTGGPAAVTATEVQCPVRGPFESGPSYYSQFYEDYVLAHVFRNVKNGVYVDVGANDPNVSSVTKHFYLAGWRGINFEPIPELVEKLKQARPEDVNLGIGVSDTVGELTFYQARWSGLSTFDPAIAERHKASGIGIRELKIPVSTLNNVFESEPLVQKGITFLNVDVEGFEKRVFTGLDFNRYRPQVIMAESTAPLTRSCHTRRVGADSDRSRLRLCDGRRPEPVLRALFTGRAATAVCRSELLRRLGQALEAHQARRVHGCRDRPVEVKHFRLNAAHERHFRRIDRAAG